MSRIFLLAPILTLSLAACNESGPLALPDVQFSQAAADRPFRVECQMRIQPPTVLSPGVLHQIDAGECKALHLGKTTLVSDKIIDLGAGTQTLQITFTAANGDVLRGTGTGTNVMVAPGIVQFKANLTLAGGTGRFASATGSATITGEANIAEARSAMVGNGSIQY